MGLLRNPRHERFAQELAKGNSTAMAYALAGYRKDKTNGFRLLKRREVRARVEQLQAEGAERAVVTLAGITARLMDVVVRAEGGDSAAMLSVARMGLVAVAKLNGLDRKVQQGRTLEDFLDALDREDAAAAAAVGEDGAA